MEPKKLQAFELYQSGMSFADIADALNIAKATAHAWVKEIEQAEQTRSFGAVRTNVQGHKGAERSKGGKVRVKEPKYVAEQKARMAELEERTRNLSEQLFASRQKQCDQLRRRCDKVRQTMQDNDGEVWTQDELDDCREQLESIREDLLDLDEAEINWIREYLDPLIVLLQEASTSLEEEDLEEGEVFFFEED